ncbi:MAG: TRAM domain-containing protein [Candidatus Omnitrophota bacterium]
MTLLFIRIFFIIISGVAGQQVGVLFEKAFKFAPLIGMGIGIGGAVIILLLEMAMKKVSLRGLSAAVFGLILGILLAKILSNSFFVSSLNETFSIIFQTVVTLVFSYLGMVLALRGKDEFNLIIPYVKFTRQDVVEDIILLDTSVIIDGRIADLCTTKFVSGKFIIPRFILRELQQIADSQDSLKRARGRRGLDILNKIQKNTNIGVKIEEEDFPDIADVDGKLIRLAKIMNAKVFTNDFNLNKVAELERIPVLNINDLANALRIVVLPGEELEVRVIKEGKEFNQGIGYLDDGTMVVVENGKHMIGQVLKVIVTSVLQTSAGRMIFSKLESNHR